MGGPVERRAARSVRTRCPCQSRGAVWRISYTPPQATYLAWLGGIAHNQPAAAFVRLNNPTRRYRSAAPPRAAFRARRAGQRASRVRRTERDNRTIPTAHLHAVECGDRTLGPTHPVTVRDHCEPIAVDATVARPVADGGCPSDDVARGSAYGTCRVRLYATGQARVTVPARDRTRTA